MHYTYAIVGGGIAGVTAAEVIRANDPRGTIAVFSSEPHLLYSRVLLPHFIKGRIKREQLFLRDISDFEKNSIDLFLEQEVTLLNVERREVRTKKSEIFSFDKLLIASGGSPRTLGVPGETLPGVFHLQTIDDADRVAAAIPQASKAVVAGGGFIALELLEILHARKIQTTLICRSDRFFNHALDAAGGELLARNFERHGFRLMFEDELERVEAANNGMALRTKRGVVLDSDFIGLGAGLKRNDDFLLGTGLSAGAGRGARVNEFLETSAPGILAAGDIAEYFDVISGEYRAHGNWTSAFLQGKTAGQNMVGRERAPFKGVPFYSITNLGFHITFLGETNESEEVSAVSRFDAASDRYERFFLKGDRLAGAVLINMFHDKPALAELIERKASIPRERLTDMAFNFKNLLGG